MVELTDVLTTIVWIVVLIGIGTVADSMGVWARISNGIDKLVKRLVKLVKRLVKLVKRLVKRKDSTPPE